MTEEAGLLAALPGLAFHAMLLFARLGAAAMLLPHGQLWLVANRHLPYEAELDARFQVWREIGGTPAFKVIEAARPRRAGKGQTR